MLLNNGVEVLWDGIKTLRITISHTNEFIGKVNGICGNFDFTRNSLDMRKGNHTYSGETYEECPGLAVADPPLAVVMCFLFTYCGKMLYICVRTTALAYLAVKCGRLGWVL